MIRKTKALLNLIKYNDDDDDDDDDDYDVIDKSIITHWIVLLMNGDSFDSFGVEYIPKENEKFIDNKNIVTNI